MGLRWSGAAKWVRVLAWCCMGGVTALLVQAEVPRSDIPSGVVARTNFVYRTVGDRRTKLDVYLPTGPAPAGGRPAVVAIHGGGWCGGSRISYGRSAAVLARHGYAVISLDYRLSGPASPSWPENIEDVREAVRWVRRHASEFGIDPGRIAAMGASAGGHLAALLGTDPDGPTGAEGPAHPAGEVSARVQAVIDFYGPTDLRALYTLHQDPTGSIALFLGGTPDDAPGRYEAASPIRHVSRDDPPMLLIHGDDDSRVPLDQSKALALALARADVMHHLIVVEKAHHGFGFQFDRHDFLPDILDFLQTVWNVNSVAGRQPTGAAR